jgi:hypothetical protein
MPSRVRVTSTPVHIQRDPTENETATRMHKENKLKGIQGCARSYHSELCSFARVLQFESSPCLRADLSEQLWDARYILRTVLSEELPQALHVQLVLRQCGWCRLGRLRLRDLGCFKHWKVQALQHNNIAYS